jgi:hypothetical protein
MEYQEFLDCIAIEDAPRPDPSITVKEFGNLCVVDELVPLPLESVASLYPRDAVLPIEDDQGAAVGFLLTCDGSPFALNEFSAYYWSAYLADISRDNYALPGHFSRSYVLIYQSRLTQYKAEFMGSSAIWGALCHRVAPCTQGIISQPPQSIVAIQGIVLPTDLHAETAARSVIQPYAFERFLKFTTSLNSVSTLMLSPRFGGLETIFEELESSSLIMKARK